MSNSRVAAIKRVDLAGLYEGWGNDCYAMVRPASYADMMELDALSTEGKSKAEQVEWQINFTKKHFISGRIPLFEGTEASGVSDMTADDVDATVELADKLFSAIIGIDIDPKVLRATAASGSEPSASELNIETSSSTASQEQPQPEQ